jgi:hypothetical protein
MATSDPQHTPADWAGLAQGLEEMRDALVATALALRDHQLTLDSPRRHAAGLEADQLIARTQARDYVAGGTRDNDCNSD